MANYVTCPACSGTGLGLFEGSRCQECKGTGEVLAYEEDDEEAEED